MQSSNSLADLQRGSMRLQCHQVRCGREHVLQIGGWIGRQLLENRVVVRAQHAVGRGAGSEQEVALDDFSGLQIGVDRSLDIADVPMGVFWTLEPTAAHTRCARHPDTNRSTVSPLARRLDLAP
jgi:hypothetical protein